MMKLTRFGAALLLGISFPSVTASIERVVSPGQSIAAKIQDAHASGDFKPRFTLNAERVDSNKTNYMVRVREAMPAVTSMTTMSIQDSTSIPVNHDDVATMLVSDEDGVIALISVDKEGGKVDGIVQKNGEKIKFTQRGGGGKVRSE
jgi:predicted ester cyclase